MLLLLTQISKCSYLLNLSNQSGRIAWLKLPGYRDHMHVVRWHRSTLLLWPSSLYKLWRTCRLL